MADRFGLLFVLLIWLLSRICPGIGQDVVCQETYYVERYSEATISCEYDPSFYTVRWYLGGSELSFLLIDDGRRSGSGYDSGEYDITDEGAMIIKRADAKHDGTYKITVLNKEGKGTSETMNVYVTVPIKTLTVQDCGSSTSPLCTDNDGANTYLVCDANHFWPSVKLHWLQISQNGSTSVAASTHTTTFENTTLLFSSRSTLQYSPDLFSFQYFTCLASGIAAHKVSSKSMEVTGNIQVEEMPFTERHLLIGDDLVIPCPINGLPFGKLQFEYNQTNDKVIKIIESCTDDNTCGENRGNVVIENVHYENEGLYQCISSDGSTAVQQETNMIIKVSPGEPNIIIEECKDQEQCPQHTVTTGSVFCTISGFRPPIYLSIETNNAEVTLDVVDETITEDESTGTSTTTVLYAYEIPECSEHVMLTCMSVPDKYSRPSFHSNLPLNSESDKCSKGGSGSAVVIVIVVMVLITVGTVSAIFICKRVKRQRTEKNKHPASDEENVPLSVEEKSEGKIFKSTKETQDKDKKSKTKKTQKEIEKLFDQDMDDYIQSKLENVRERLENFQLKHQVQVFPLFKAFVEHKSIDNKVILSLVTRLVASGRCDWLTPSAVLELLDIAFNRNQLSFGDRLIRANEMYSQKQIDITEYALETVNNFDSHKGEFSEVFNDLTTTHISFQDDVMEMLGKCVNTFLSPQHPDTNDLDGRESFLKSIVSLEDDTQVLRQFLLVCVEQKSVDVNDFLQLLHGNKEKLNANGFYQKLASDYTWVSVDTVILLFKGVKNIEIKTDKFLVDQLLILVSKKKLPPSEFTSQLKDLRETYLISEDVIIEQFGVWITNVQMLAEEHMEVICQVMAQQLVSTETFIEKVILQGRKEDMASFLFYVVMRQKDLTTTIEDILRAVIKKFQLEAKEVDAILQLTEVSDNDRREFFSHKEVSDSFLENKRTPWELQPILDLIPYEGQKQVLTNRKVVDAFLAIKVKDEKVVEDILKNERDDKSWRTMWLKFVFLNLPEPVQSSKSQKSNDKRVDSLLLCRVIKAFKAKPSDIKTVLDNLNIPFSKRVSVLTEKKFTQKLLESKKKEEKWKLEEWIELIVMLTNNNQESGSEMDPLIHGVTKEFKISEKELRARIRQKLPETYSTSDAHHYEKIKSSVTDSNEEEDRDTEEKEVEDATTNISMDENNGGQIDGCGEKEGDTVEKQST